MEILGSKGVIDTLTRILSNKKDNSGKCEGKIPEGCSIKDGCVYFEKECISSKVPGFELINKDPDAFAESKDTQSLDYLVRLASFLYFNYDGGGLDDNAFDALDYHLRKRMKSSARKYDKIGAPPLEKIACTLPFKMPSLRKLKPGMKELYDRLATDKIWWSVKLDGCSCLIHYEKGKIKGMFTRGDGVVGGDITDISEFIQNLKPKVKLNAFVRGELVIEKEVCKTKYPDYVNARSFVNAKVNSGYISEGLKDIRFVPYSLIHLLPSEDYEISKNRNRYDDMSFLSKAGFEVVENGVFDSPLVFDLISKYKEKRESLLTGSKYLIDGLVIDDMTPLSNPVAFKMLLESQIRHTSVTDIDWRITRYGKFVPVVMYKAVYIDGVRLRKASAYNAGYVKNNNISEGSELDIARSGDVIPRILKVYPSTLTPLYPPNTYKWHWNRSDIILDDIEGNREVQIRRMMYFLEVLEISGVGEATLQKLWEVGITTPIKLVTVSPKQMMVPGIKAVKDASGTILVKARSAITEAGANKLYTNIKNRLSKTRLDRLMVASPYFKGIGKKTSHTLFSLYPEVIQDVLYNPKNLGKKFDSFPKGSGIGPAMLKTLLADLPKFAAFLKELNSTDVLTILKSDLNRLEKIRKGEINKKILNKGFVLTGFMGHTNFDLEDYIYDNGGEILSGLSPKVSSVIAANISEISEKMIKAKEMSIRVCSVEEFSRIYETGIGSTVLDPDSVFLE